MLPLTKKLQLVAIGLLCSLFFGQVANVLSIRLAAGWNLIQSLDNFFYYLFFNPASHKLPSDLVIIDNEDPAMTRGRAEYAEMIRRLQGAGVEAIAFDLYFAGESDQDKAGDRALCQAVKEFPTIVLAADFSVMQRPNAVQAKMAEDLALPDSICKIAFPIVYVAEGVILPFDSLLSEARYLGHINYPESDFHHFPPVYQYDQDCYAALPLQMARLHAEMHGREFHWAEIPTDKYAQMLVNFIPLEHFAPFPYSWQHAEDLLESRLEAFQGKIVLIANCGGEPNVPTPVGSYPRWAIIASVASQAMLDNHVAASEVFSPALFSALLVILGLFWLLFGAPHLGPRWQRTRYLFAGGNLAILLLVFFALHYSHEWFGAVVPLTAYNGSLVVVRARYYGWTRPPAYLNFGLTITRAENKKYFMQIFESPVGEEEEHITLSPFFVEEEFQRVLRKLAILQADRHEMKGLGDRLFHALFQREIFNAFKSSLQETSGQKKHLRLKLRLDAPELSCLPWELLHTVKLPPGFLSLHRRMSIVRYLPLAQPIRPTVARIPLRILVAVASPMGLPPLDTAAELKLIKKSLRSIVWGGDVQLRFCEHVTLEKLSAELERDPDILHFIGHGRFDSLNKEAWLEFETETGEIDSIEAEALGNLLHEVSIKLVVLNSCEGAVAAHADAFTGMAQSLVRVGVPAVVAMQFPILDSSAALFTKEFYSSLITNYSIDAAVTSARRSLMTHSGLGQQDWATPVLFMRAHDGQIFSSSY